jgi:hypothetical protein
MIAAELSDPVDPAQRRQARTLGLLVGGGFVALVAAFIAIFSITGLPKDPKEWKRLQERRAAAEAERAGHSATPESPAPKDPIR